MKKWKKTLMAMGIMILVGIILKMYFNPENKIRNFVNRNEEELVEIAVQYLTKEKIITSERVYYKNVEIDGLQEGEHPIVQFYYSGFGIAPSGVYYGFYYSPDNVPVAIMDSDSPLKPSGQGEWMWSGYGDNGGMTKRIKENWFYYETWF